MQVTETAHWLKWQDWANPILQQPYELRDGKLHIPERAGRRAGMGREGGCRSPGGRLLTVKLLRLPRCHCFQAVWLDEVRDFLARKSEIVPHSGRHTPRLPLLPTVSGLMFW
jgi:hypothetical protein